MLRERKISFMRVLVGFIRSMGYLFGSLGYFIIKKTLGYDPAANEAKIIIEIYREKKVTQASPG